jgi:cytochrome b subunit of formate dehydrogenase
MFRCYASRISLSEGLPMDDFAFDRPAGRSPRVEPPAGAPQSRSGRAPRTDVGTILIHWTASIACFITLATGLRLASDQEFSVVWRAIAPILPQGEIWSWHILSGLALTFASTAYIVYMHRSGLARRTALSKLRVLAGPAPRKMKWGALNVLLNWLLYGLVVVQTLTGILLYLGYGGVNVTVHSVAATLVLLYIAAHLIGHFGYGGWLQLLRVFKPAPLAKTAGTRARPLLVATAVGTAVAAGLAVLDLTAVDRLVIRPASDAPTLDGRMDDGVWRTARPVFIRTMQGSNLAGGESTVEVRAVRTDRKVYFAFRWEDPSRSLRRLPMIKKEDGWHVVGNNADTADVTTFYEDKFAVLFSSSDGFGNAGSTHMGRTPLAAGPAAVNARGLHYTTDGSYADVWQWKASRGGHLGYVDDQYFGPPRDPTPAEASGKARYQGGYWNDPGRAFYSYNYKMEVGHRGPVQLLRLPRDLAATVEALGRFDLDPDSSDQEGARWWMTEAESVPYAKELDDRIPIGTVLPGVLITGNYEGDRANLRGEAKWKDGAWTLEVERDLATGSSYDVAFKPGQPLFMWVSAFDHSQTRHTRHMRPVRVEFGE